MIRYWTRLLWDSAAFHLIIKKRGRVPASDSFVVKRIAGPGLASNFFYQVCYRQNLTILTITLLSHCFNYKKQERQPIFAFLCMCGKG